MAMPTNLIGPDRLETVKLGQSLEAVPLDRAVHLVTANLSEIEISSTTKLRLSILRMYAIVATEKVSHVLPLLVQPILRKIPPDMNFSGFRTLFTLRLCDSNQC